MKFCYGCGRLGHDDDVCPFPKNEIYTKQLTDGMRTTFVKRISPAPLHVSHVMQPPQGEPTQSSITTTPLSTEPDDLTHITTSSAVALRMLLA